MSADPPTTAPMTMGISVVLCLDVLPALCPPPPTVGDGVVEDVFPSSLLATSLVEADETVGACVIVAFGSPAFSSAAFILSIVIDFAIASASFAFAAFTLV